MQVIAGVQASMRTLVITGCTVYCRGAGYVWALRVQVGAGILVIVGVQ